MLINIFINTQQPLAQKRNKLQKVQFISDYKISQYITVNTDPFESQNTIQKNYISAHTSKQKFSMKMKNQISTCIKQL